MSFRYLFCSFLTFISIFLFATNKEERKQDISSYAKEDFAQFKKNLEHYFSYLDESAVRYQHNAYGQLLIQNEEKVKEQMVEANEIFLELRQKFREIGLARYRDDKNMILNTNWMEAEIIHWYIGTIALNFFPKGWDPCKGSLYNEESSLFWAVYTGDLPLVSSLLDQGANINQRNSAGETPLHWACARGDSELVAALVERGALVDEQDDYGSTPILEAAWSVQGEDAALCLLEHGADWTVIDYDRWGFEEENSVLHVAAARGHNALIVALLERGMDVDTCNNLNNTPLGMASEHDCETTVSLLLDAGADPSTTVLGTSPLHYASMRGRCKLILTLLDKGAPIDQGDENGKTPLMYAVGDGDNRDVVALLLARGADPLLVPDSGETLLHTVRADRVLDMLLETPIDLNQEDHEGYTPLMHAASDQSSDWIAQRLLEAGADLSKQDLRGRTALHHACQSGCLGLIEDLLSRGALLDEQDKEGITPLMVALESKWGGCEAASLLCEKGADIHLADHRGRTPLFFAAAHSDGEEMALRLLKAGADPCPIDMQDGSSALHHASASGHRDLIAALLDQNVPVDIVDHKGCSPLWHVAGSWLSDKRAVDLLIARGADIQAVDETGETVLHRAAGAGAQERVAALLHHGGDVRAVDASGKTPLLAAASSFSGEAAALDLLVTDSDINATDQKGRSVFYYAVSHEHQQLITSLLEREVDVYKALAQRQDLQSRITALSNGLNIILYLINGELVKRVTEDDIASVLCWAVLQGEEAFVQTLLDRGADIHQCKRAGKPLLHVACKEGHSEIVRVLLANGALIDERDNERRTPLLVAAGSKNGQETAICLLQHGADWKVVDDWGIDGNSLLHIAAINGHDALVSALIERGLDIDVRNQSGKTPLMVASDKAQESAARLLLDAGADVCAVESLWGRSALHFASAEGACELIQLLLEQGAPIDQLASEGGTPLMYAVRAWGTEKAVALLLARGADPLLVIGEGQVCFAEEGQTLLHQVNTNANSAVLERILQTPIDLDAVDLRGQTPLMRAANQLEAEWIALKLLEAGADPSKKDQDGKTALHYACQSGQYEFIESLLDRGVSIDERDNKGMTPLMASFAWPCSNWEVSSLLLRKGANIHLADHRGRTPLFFAAASDGLEEFALRFLEAGANPCPIDGEDGRSAIHCASSRTLVTALLDYNVPVNLTDHAGCSPLWYAAGSGNQQRMDLLIKRGADIDLVAKNGQTPLICAAYWAGSEQLALNLLEAGASPSSTDERGRTALHYACEGRWMLLAACPGKQRALVEALLARGAPINQQDHEGITPLMIATDGQEGEIVASLLKAGANVDLVDHQGRTALLIAAAARCGESMALRLLQAGADRHGKSKEGLTALDYAIARGHRELARQLQS